MHFSYELFAIFIKRFLTKGDSFLHLKLNYALNYKP